MGGKHIPFDIREKIANEFIQGEYGMKDIALKYGCSASSVCRIVNELTIRSPKIIKIPATAEAVTGESKVNSVDWDNVDEKPCINGSKPQDKYSTFYSKCQATLVTMSEIFDSIYEGLDENEKRIWELGMINAEINNLRRNNDE